MILANEGVPRVSAGPPRNNLLSYSGAVFTQGPKEATHRRSVASSLACPWERSPGSGRLLAITGEVNVLCCDSMRSREPCLLFSQQILTLGESRERKAENEMSRA